MFEEEVELRTEKVGIQRGSNIPGDQYDNNITEIIIIIKKDNVKKRKMDISQYMLSLHDKMESL